MQINVDIESLQKSVNPKFRPLLANKDDYLICRGGAGSGKSVFVAQKLLLRVLIAMMRGYKHRILALRKVSPNARNSVFKELRDQIGRWEMHDLVKINKTDMSLNFVDGSEILCTGLDDPEKIKSVAGITSIWMEESNEFTIDHFKQLDMRMRGITEDYYQIIMSFNPISKNSWIYDEFFKNPKEDATCHHSTYKDNLYLDEKYIKKRESEKDPYYHAVYTLGEWGVLGGIIYTNWQEVSRFPRGMNMKIHGLDFGYSNSPTAMVGVGKNDNGFFFKELLYRLKMTNADLIDWMERNIDRSAIIYADSAEPARIAEIKKEGFNIKPARKGKNSVLNGIDYLKRQKLFITSDSPNMLKEVTSYHWKEDKKNSTDNEKVYLDIPVPEMDHTLDAGRYACWTHWGRLTGNHRLRFL